MEDKKGVATEDTISTWQAFKNLMLAAVPIIFSTVFQVLLEVICVAFVGNLNDPNAVATVGLAVLTIN